MDPQETVTEYRLKQLEEAVRNLRGDLKAAVGELSAGMTQLQQQLTNYQALMNDRFVLRRDYDKAVQVLEGRLEQFVAKEDDNHTRAWVALTAIGAAGSFVAALLSWFRPLH